MRLFLAIEYGKLQTLQNEKGVSHRMVYKNRIKWRKIQQNNKFAGAN